jgi:hypothetical protein
MTTALTLAAEEREVVLAEIEAVRAAAQAGEYRDVLDAAVSAVESGSVESEQLTAELDRILGLGLQTGRIRALYGPGGEQAALKAFRKLPTGKELAETANAVNEALASLQGRSLDQISITASGPGAFTLSLVAGGAEISVRLDRQGARLASVGV